MAKILQLGKTEPGIEPELKEFIDTCLVPVLVRSALKEIQAVEAGGVLECTSSLHIRCANGDLR